ncbi:hypothetical protein Pmani_018532 [Petrolisthes manimaculis]|uniref:Uncharacterized protein n=1 Tax=Petrolisthes manimaculis TaxID=1843537 RepID=A0AAE1U4F9_9EUCA|nr:hypothetical protein Pmani_018532 [Petrolisthes manimaculis]
MRKKLVMGKLARWEPQLSINLSYHHQVGGECPVPFNGVAHKRPLAKIKAHDIEGEAYQCLVNWLSGETHREGSPSIPFSHPCSYLLLSFLTHGLVPVTVSVAAPTPGILVVSSYFLPNPCSPCCCSLYPCRPCSSPSSPNPNPCWTTTRLPCLNAPLIITLSRPAAADSPTGRLPPSAPTPIPPPPIPPPPISSNSTSSHSPFLPLYLVPQPSSPTPPRPKAHFSHSTSSQSPLLPPSTFFQEHSPSS